MEYLSALLTPTERPMSRSSGTRVTLVYRLSQVLTKLNMGESLDPRALADEFGVDLRTVQRDLNVRFACLQLVKTGGRYRLEESRLGKLTIEDIERFASLSGVRGLFPQLTDRFLRGIFAGGKANAWLVKGHHYEDLRGQTAVFAELELAIVERRQIQFTYNKTPDQSKVHSEVEPYKLINNKGIWYLAAWDGGKLKSFTVAKVGTLKAESTTFSPRTNIESELAASDSIWLGAQRQRVLIRVNNQVTEYFRRRKLLPNQVIEKELAGGDILVSATVAHANEVLPLVRYWLPHARILEPLALQQEMEAGLAAYLTQAAETPQQISFSLEQRN